MRAALFVAGAFVLAALVIVLLGVSAPPLERTCDPAMEDVLCSATVDAALERGLGRIHPLILSGHVEPGPAAAPMTTGHEATVYFDLLGVPGPTAVRMFTDMGGHWGGAVDRSEEEVALWALAPLFVAAVMAVVLLLIVGRPRRATG